MFWSVAQLVERRTVNSDVTGSCPVRPAMRILHSDSA